MIRLFVLTMVCSAMLLGVSTATAQSAVKKGKLKGNWKLVVDVDQDSDSALERVILNSIDGVLDEIDVYFQFKADGELKVSVNAFGEKDVEQSDWTINDDGQLILGDVKQVSTDESVWMFSRSRLYAYNYEDGKLVREDVYLKRLD